MNNPLQTAIAASTVVLPLGNPTMLATLDEGQSYMAFYKECAESRMTYFNFPLQQNVAYQFDLNPNMREGEGIGLLSDVEVDGPINSQPDAELEVIFNGLAKEWIEATRSYSLNMRRYAHPTYQSLMHALGKEDVKEVVPLILRELQQRPDVWFEALKVLTKRNPASQAKTFDETVRAWLEWGKAEKYIV